MDETFPNEWHTGNPSQNNDNKKEWRIQSNTTVDSALVLCTDDTSSILGIPNDSSLSLPGVILEVRAWHKHF